MKKLFLIGLLFFSIETFSQTATFKDLQDGNKGSYTEYITTNNESFKVGDTITIGTAAREKSFSYVYFSSGMGIQTPLPIVFSNCKAIIKKININSGNMLVIKTLKPLSGVPYPLLIGQIDEAIAQGEVKSNVITSTDALTKLKTEKDKFDLGIITKEQYEAKKADLVKYIK